MAHREYYRVYPQILPSMQTIHRTLLVLSIIALAVAPVFPQHTDSSKTEKKLKSDASHQELRSDGLSKIVTRKTQNWDFDTPINHQELEKKIEDAVERAMKSVEVALEKLEITIDPIEINLKDLNVDIDPIVANIPNLKIDIEPVEVDLDHDVDINTDFHHHHFDATHHDDKNKNDDDHVRSKDTSRSTSQDEEKKEKEKSKEKSKGLKKLN